MPILLFDGHCNLCNTSVQWILKRDKHAVFKFAPLQSEIGQDLLNQHGLSDASLDSVVCIDGENAFILSDAPLEIVWHLGFPWSILYVFKLVPTMLRHPLYKWIAKNRYRWFGKKEQCMLPKPEWKTRFL